MSATQVSGAAAASDNFGTSSIVHNLHQMRMLDRASIGIDKSSSLPQSQQ